MSRLISLMALMLGVSQAFAFQYQIRCDADKKLTRFRVLGSSFDSATEMNTDEGWVALRDPLDTLYSNRAARYRIDRVQEVIRAALEAEVDPYMALAVAAVENPLDGSERSENYRFSWGNPAVDGSGAGTAVGCVAAELDGNGIWRNRTNNLVELRLANSGRRELMEVGVGWTSTFGPVSDAAVAAGVSEKLKSGEKLGGCYFFVNGIKADWRGSTLDVENEKLYKEEVQAVRSQLGALYMNYKFNHARSLIASGRGVWTKTATWRKFKKSEYYQLAIIAQGYNGYGLYGAKERTGSCVTGIQTAKDPIYGAGVLHLALNMILANSHLRSLVDAQVQELGISSIASQFCLTWGTGVHNLDPKGFAAIQSRIVRPRETDACRRSVHTYDFRR